MMQYPDHHIFTIDDLNDIKKRYEQINTKNKMIVTTEKDAVRLMKFQDQINELPLYVIPVQHEFLFEEGNIFDELTMDFIKKFKRSDN
jgi:tetraacyldisaccharide 4'-kinase